MMDSQNKPSELTSFFLVLRSPLIEIGCLEYHLYPVPQEETFGDCPFTLRLFFIV